MKKDDRFEIDDDEFKIDGDEFLDENRERKTEELEPSEQVPVNDKIETIHFPWSIAVIMGFLMVVIITLIVLIKVIGQ